MKKTNDRARTLYECAQVLGVVETLFRICGGNIKVAIPFLGDITDEPIEALELSVRAYNCLMRAGIRTVGDAIDLANENSIAQMRNAGKKTVSEIKTRLLVLGYEMLDENGKIAFFERLLKDNRAG